MERIIVIGGGIAGVSAALGARKQNEKIEIIIIEKEKYIGYLRGKLPYIISGKINYDKVIPRIDFLKEKRIQVFLSSIVNKIDLNDKKITFMNSEKHERTIDFSKIIFATGSIPLSLNVRGRNLDRIYELRTIEDAIKINKEVMRNMKVVIVGGGLVAVKTAESLLKRGCKIVMIFPEPEILYRVFDDNIGKVFREKMEKRGVEVIHKNSVKAFYGTKSVEATDTEKGVIPCDMVILALGSKPNTVLARRAGIPLGQHDGIIVDERMETVERGVYAAGDCAEYTNFITKEKEPIHLAALAFQSGEVAGINAAGGSERMGKIIENISAKIFGTEILSVGITLRETKNFRIKVLSSYLVLEKNDCYKSKLKTYINLIFDSESRKLIGAQMIGKGAMAWSNFLTLSIIKEVSVKEMAYFCYSYSPKVNEIMAEVIAAAKRAKDLFG
ncbi:MAG: FAD-dependent oxidoreductase [Nitrososphaeria archaeon]|nr:FAD-dependent oxidoreductase [Nitrososphaeria archaeon]